jgi:hypothetical protein
MPLYQTFYLSRPAAGLANHDIQQILLAARQKNWRLNLTGCLLFSGQHFAQVLEGPAEAVSSLLERLRRDPRHTDLRVLVTRPVPTRAYADWAMGMVYALDQVDRLEALMTDAHTPAPAAIEFMAGMEVDSLMGPLS